MKLHGFAAKLLDFKDTEPKDPVLISRPFDARAKVSQPLQGLLADQYAFLDVPFVHQQHINLCGDASVNMLLAYYRKPTNDLTKNPRGVFEGLAADGIIAQMKEKGLNPTRVWLPTTRSIGCQPNPRNLAADPCKQRAERL